MADKGRLVYSTEHGQIGSPMDRQAKKKRPALNAAPAIKNPAKQGVRVGRESKGRGGKTVCVIRGLNLPDAELKALLKRLQGRLGTGGAIKDGCIEIQGDHRDRLLALLEAEGHKAKASGG